MPVRILVLCLLLGVGATHLAVARQSAPLAIVGIGDSLALGLGASKRCAKPLLEPADSCTSGTSFIDNLARMLARRSDVKVQNVAVGGSWLGGVVSDQIPRIDPAATLVAVYAGTNDVRGIADNPDLPASLASEKVGIATMISEIRKRAPKARIIMANIPNLSRLRYLGTDSSYYAKIHDAVLGLDGIINGLVEDNVSIVDLLCDPRSYDLALRGSDVLHYNDAGYKYVAEKFYAAVTKPHLPDQSCPAQTDSHL